MKSSAYGPAILRFRTDALNYDIVIANCAKHLTNPGFVRAGILELQFINAAANKVDAEPKRRACRERGQDHDDQTRHDYHSRKQEEPATFFYNLEHVCSPLNAQQGTIAFDRAPENADQNVQKGTSDDHRGKQIQD